ncbi:MAG: hypothetical protein J6X35_00605 [Bacteroidales bacterium]|nr:hypothetical protein [Bacteroidales bacterium]MBP5612636.1 hypothetical protein [Bacteroidales bacterium]
MMKRYIVYLWALLLALPVSGLRAQQTAPSGAKFGFGLSVNPISGLRANNDFKSRDFVGNAIAAEAAVPYQMFLLAQSPMVSVSGKLRLGEKMALKGSVGFSGAYFNYVEYVPNDKERFFNPFSEEVVTDRIRFHLSGGGVSLGLECGSDVGKRFRISGGASLLYSYGGAVINFDYGNEITDINRNPSIMPLIADSLNMYVGNVDVADARPLKRYNVGFEHGFGLMLDLGAEFFLTPKVSLGLNATITPFMLVVQPQTYTVYEGYSNLKGEAIELNRLVSPGSTSILYGTENLGLVLSVHYYL